MSNPGELQRAASSLALARLWNSSRLAPDIPTFRAEYRDIPRLNGAGWYPHPSKARRLPNGNAEVRCHWDGARWTDRCQIWSEGRWTDVVWSPHAPPAD